MATTPVEPLNWLFVDTSIWLYTTDPPSQFHVRALTALNEAQDAGTRLVTSPQVLREYLAVGTRPGVMGPSPSLVDLLANGAEIRKQCFLIEETTSVVDQLALLLETIPTAYRRIHDANIVASMLTRSVSRLLTYNSKDFAAYNHLIAIEPVP